MEAPSRFPTTRWTLILEAKGSGGGIILQFGNLSAPDLLSISAGPGSDKPLATRPAGWRCVVFLGCWFKPRLRLDYAALNSAPSGTTPWVT